MIQSTRGYLAIAHYYGSRRAVRSGVLLIDHINQGLAILDRLGADDVTKEAFAVHPIFQADDDLKENFQVAADLDPMVVLYAMEYRNCANAFLSHVIEKIDDQGEKILRPKRPLHLSPLAQVNLMLVADKVQNRKDFELYHKGQHKRSDELDFYFKFWLQRLDISEDRYQELIKGL